jgi:hypothetical protein
MYSLAVIIFVFSEKKAFEHFPIGSNVNLCIGYGRTWFNIVPYGKNVSKRFFSETTWTIETKLPRNDHWKVLYKKNVFYVDRISYRNKKRTVCRGPSNEHACTVWL